MDDWCLAWKPGCDVAWEAWLAGLTLLAVVVAYRAAGEQRREREQSEFAEAMALSGIFKDELLQFVRILRGIATEFGMEQLATREIFIAMLEAGRGGVRERLVQALDFVRLPDMERLMPRAYVMGPVGMDALRRCRHELLELRACQHALATFDRFDDLEKAEHSRKVPDTIARAARNLTGMAELFDEIHRQCRERLPNKNLRVQLDH